MSLSSDDLVLLVDDRHSRSSRTQPLRASYRLWERLILHACIFKHVRPLAACASVTVLQVLSKMICPEELFCVIALPKLVRFLQMPYSRFPILICRYGYLGHIWGW